MTMRILTTMLAGGLVVAGLGVAGGSTPTAGAAPGIAERSCRQIVDSWSDRRLAAQVTTISADSGDLSSAEHAVKSGAGAVILFGDDPPSDLRQQIAKLSHSAPGGVAPTVMTDEEGGGVQRVASLVGSLPWARQVAHTETVTQAAAQMRTVAKRMKAAGIDMDLAPVLDLSNGPGPDDHHPDGKRSYSLRPKVTTAYGVAVAKALQSQGVVPVVKHFPGLGTANDNTDLAPATTAPLAQLERHDLKPFEAAIQAGLPAVMVANAKVPGLTGKPASLSFNAITTFLEHKLGFTGLVMTDALTAKAITDTGLTPQAAAVQALKAGEDLVINGGGAAGSETSTFNRTVTAIADAVAGGTLSRSRLRNAVTHVLAVKHLDRCS